MGFLKEILEERRDELATAVVQEMGKPIAQAQGEITKSI
jgi:acyl-CoA reductase-like NAD-dependent aldehyde dehydrogenase